MKLLSIKISFEKYYTPSQKIALLFSKTKSYIIQSILTSASGSAIQGYSSTTEDYSIISFDSPVSFITGDAIYYQPESTSITGLTTGIYYAAFFIC